MSITEILKQRGEQNGDYSLQSDIEQEIKTAIYSTARTDMSPYMKSSIDQIAHKLARIATGDIWHEDHWRDIEGYARLSADRVCSRNTTPPTSCANCGAHKKTGTPCPMCSERDE